MVEASAVRHALVVEDDLDGCAMLMLALEQIGAEVVVATDGGRFLVAIASQYRDGNTVPKPDLIVTDVIMPVCNGLAVLEAIRDAHWTTPVIVVSGRGTAAVRASVAKCGATFMLKPIDLGVFQQTALRLLAHPTS